MTTEPTLENGFHQAKSMLSQRFLYFLLAAFLLFFAAFLACFMQQSPPPSPQTDPTFLSLLSAKARHQAEILAGEGRLDEALIGLQESFRSSPDPLSLNPMIVSFCASQARVLLMEDSCRELSPEKTKNIAVLWDKALRHSMQAPQRLISPPLPNLVSIGSPSKGLISPPLPESISLGSLSQRLASPSLPKLVSLSSSSRQPYSEAVFANASPPILPLEALPKPKMDQLPLWEPVLQKLERLSDSRNNPFLRQEILQFTKIQRAATQTAKLIPILSEMVRMRLTENIERVELAIAAGEIFSAEAQIRKLEHIDSGIPDLRILGDKITRKKEILGLLSQVHEAMNISEFSKAGVLCQQVLRLDPDNASAALYLSKIPASGTSAK